MIRRTVSGRKPARGYSARPAGRPAGPRPVQPWRRPMHCTCAGVVTVRRPRLGRRGGALAGGLAAASRWQVSWLGHHRHTADVPGKKSRGRAHQAGRGGKVLDSSTTAKSRLRLARRAEVGRWWGGRERPAQWHSYGGQLRGSGGVLGGGLAARGGGEGGDCECGVGAGRKAWCRGKFSGRRHAAAPF
jgi:hypothetical protein